MASRDDRVGDLDGVDAGEERRGYELDAHLRELKLEVVLAGVLLEDLAMLELRNLLRRRLRHPLAASGHCSCLGKRARRRKKVYLRGDHVPTSLGSSDIWCTSGV